ncbi:MAG: superoxide dismutase [Bacteriovoracaceae bacterium]
MEHQLPPLPYPKDALAPYISKETMEYHYEKHHRGYVTKLNKLIQNTKFEYMPLEEIILSSEGKIYNNAAQVWNHSFFWKCLSPEAGGEAKGEVANLINKKWQSFDKFKQEFSEMAENLFGSGWTWLVLDKQNNLEIINTSNAQTPKSLDKKALLTIDVWEHAYYIDYRNARPEFIKGYWNIVNWDFVNALLTKS